MEIPVLIERVAEGRYVARCGFGLTAEGPTEYHARFNLQREVDRVLNHGGQVMTITIPDPPQEPPLMKHVGSLDLNDPEVQEWQQITEERRRELDREMEAELEREAGAQP